MYEIFFKKSYLISQGLDCHQTCDLDLIFKVKRQLTDVKFPLK